MRLWSWSFSRMLRMWFFTVFSVSRSWRATPRLVAPSASSPRISISVVDSSGANRWTVGRLGPSRQRGVLVEELAGHGRGDEAVAPRHRSDRADYVTGCSSFQDVSHRPRLERLEQVVSRVGGGQHQDPGRGDASTSSRVASIPSTLGMRTSINTTSEPTPRRPRRPRLHLKLGHDLDVGVSSRAFTRPRRNRAWSSHTTTRTSASSRWVISALSAAGSADEVQPGAGPLRRQDPGRTLSRLRRSGPHRRPHAGRRRQSVRWPG